MFDLGQITIRRAVNGYVVMIQYPGRVDSTFTFMKTKDMTDWLCDHLPTMNRDFQIVCDAYDRLCQTEKLPITAKE